VVDEDGWAGQQGNEETEDGVEGYMIKTLAIVILYKSKTEADEESKDRL